MKSTSTYFFYENDRGRPTRRWQSGGRVLVPGCRFGRFEAYPPDVRWVVAAETEAEAKRFIAASTTTASHPDGLGVLWDADKHLRPIPFGTTVLWGLESLCGAPALSLWKTYEDAAERSERLTQTRCGALCTGDHRIIQITLEEVRRFRNTRWVWVTFP